MAKKYSTLVLILALVGIILVSGCILGGAGEEDEGETPVVCNAPYIQVGAECCLDQNSNDVCDSDEVGENETPETPPGDECVTADDCDDEQECTTDTCTNGYCYHTLEAGCLLVEEHNLEITHKQSYTEDDGFHVVGQVKNVGNKTQQNGKVTITLYNSYGKKISTYFAYTTIRKIKEKEKSPFDVNVGNLPNDYFSYTAEVESENAETEPYTKVTISIDSSVVDDRSYEITGKVKNSGNQVAKDVEVVAVFYDKNNKVIRVETDSIDENLAQGASRSFHIKLEGSVVRTYTDDLLVQAEVA